MTFSLYSAKPKPPKRLKKADERNYDPLNQFQQIDSTNRVQIKMDDIMSDFVTIQLPTKNNSIHLKFVRGNELKIRIKKNEIIKLDQDKLLPDANPAPRNRSMFVPNKKEMPTRGKNLEHLNRCSPRKIPLRRHSVNCFNPKK